MDKDRRKKLSEFSEEELFEEIHKRWEERKDKPKQLENPDPIKLRNVCDEYLRWLEKERRGNRNLEHFIFEHALKAIYGEDIFFWINEQLD